MRKIETIKEFYEKLPDSINTLPNGGIGHFNVFKRQFPTVTASYIRRDFYKIALILGTGIIRYGNREVIVDKPALFFSNPLVPHSWQATSENQDGWFCLFSDDFMQSFNRKVKIQDYPMFKLDGNPLIFLNDDSLTDIAYIFNKMLSEKNTNYIYKFSKLNNYLQLLIHEALEISPDSEFSTEKNDAAHRITFQFLELLGKQFPVESPQTPLQLRTAKDYAERLCIHVNHLNRSVKEVTGKSPSTHIIMRIADEGKALLKNTDWTISEVAFTLGFEYPSHFTAFLKKHLGYTPKDIRKSTEII